MRSVLWLCFRSVLKAVSGIGLLRAFQLRKSQVAGRYELKYVERIQLLLYNQVDSFSKQ